MLTKQSLLFVVIFATSNLISGTGYEREKQLEKWADDNRSLAWHLEDIDSRRTDVQFLRIQPGTAWEQRKQAFKEAALVQLAKHHNPVSDFVLKRFLLNSHKEAVAAFTNKYPQTIPAFKRLARKERVNKSVPALIRAAATAEREALATATYEESNLIERIADALNDVHPKVARELTPVTVALFTQDLQVEHQTRLNYPSFVKLYSTNIERDPGAAVAFSKAILDNPSAKFLTEPKMFGGSIDWSWNAGRAATFLNTLTKHNPESLEVLAKAAAENKWCAQYAADKKQWVSERATLQTELYTKEAGVRTKNGVPC